MHETWRRRNFCFCYVLKSFLFNFSSPCITKFIVYPKTTNMTTHSTENMKKTGEKLRYLRVSKGMKLTTTANALRVHHTTISRIENGHQNLSLNFLYELLEYYNIPIEDFFEKI